MKTSKYIRQLFAFVLVFALFGSCRKSDRGCRDKSAENYEPNASTDCGCCFYYGKIYVWYSYDYYRNKLDGTYTKLYFYLDNNLQSQTKKDLLLYSEFSSSPNVNGDYAYYQTERLDNVMVMDLGKEKTKTMVLSVKTEHGNVIWSGNVVFKAGIITLVQMQ